MATQEHETIMECPLVKWLDNFRPQGSANLQYSDLYNAVYLSDVMQSIDSRPAYQDVTRSVTDFNVRLQNWDILMRNIKAYYTDVLQQVLIVNLPNIQMICRDPEKDASFGEIKKTILLILGCAVQCEYKEHFIKDIMDLELGVQQEIVESIKQITDDSQSILPSDCQDRDKIFNHLIRLVKERNDYADVMSDLAQERDYYRDQAEGKSTIEVSPTGSPEKHHLVVELTECKARIRKLKQDLDDKQESLSDLRDENEEQNRNLSKLRNENVELLRDARSARTLRDELDILREKMGRVHNYEAEILKYKERLNEMEFYKARVEELREDNAILIENKAMLDEQLSASHKRIETVVQLEQEMVKYRQQIEDMSAERDEDRERIRMLAEENAQLQFHKKTSMNESTNLEQELEATKAKIAGVGGAISDQLKETTNAKILRLELENQHLQRKIEEMRESSLIENTTLHLQLEKENQRLSTKVEKLQQDVRETSQKCYDLEEQTRELARDKDRVVQTVEITKDSAERQIRELEEQNEDLKNTMEVLRSRNEQTNDTKLKDLERENKRLHETISVKNQNLSKAEFENRQLKKTYDRARDNVDTINKLENEKDSLERKNMELKHRIQAQEFICEKADKLEQEHSNMDLENQKLQRKLQSLQTTIQKKETVEQENINIKVENQKLQKMLENLKHSTSKVADVENENSLLKKELQQLQRTVESKKTQGVKLEKMELDLMDLDNENVKLQKTLEVTANRVKQLEKDNYDLETEIEKLQEQLESSKYSQKRLTESEKQVSKLEQDCMKIQKENVQLAKENKRNKVTLEARENTIDELTTQYSMLELSHMELKRSVAKDTHLNSRESEREHKELLQNLQANQTIASLRTELKNEKIRTQELNNELEMLHQDLEKVGFRMNQLVANSPQQHETRFKALESMMQDSLNQSLHIKEDKIHALESRLDESKNRNVKLQEELRITRRECESLKQRFEEESLGKERERLATRHESSRQESSRQSLAESSRVDTSHLVKLERHNATLLAENNKLNELMQRERDSIQVEKKSLGNLQAVYNKLRDDHDRLKTAYDSLKSDYDRLKGEYERLKAAHSAMDSEKRDVLAENKNMKTELNMLQQENTELKDKLKNMEYNFNFLATKYDSLFETHQNILEDKEQLMNQMELLIGKNQELLNHVLGSKDQMVGQEKSYMEQMADLRRQKELLEQKIMDHYKQRDKQKKNKSFGAMLMQKVRGLKRSKSRPNLTEGSPDDSSLGSGSYAEAEGENLTKTDKRRYRSRRRGSSAGGLGNADSPRLSKQKRGLARSTTALDASTSGMRRKISPNDLRGWNASSATLCTHGDSISDNNNKDFTLPPGMGRPVSDDEWGFSSGRKNSNSSNNVSNTPDFLTLEEFLAEGLDKSGSPKSKRKIELRQEDTESRSSENSDGSARRRRPAPLPPSSNHRSRFGSTPDVLAVSQPDLSMSRMSHVSTGSSGSSQDVRAESAFTQVSFPSYTSTPAKNQQGYGHKPFEDLNNSAFSRVSSGMNNGPFNHVNSPQYKYNDTVDVVSPPAYQGKQEPTPDRDNSRLTPSSRLDILTRGNPSPASQGGWTSSPNYSSPRDQRSRPQDTDMSVRSAQSSQQHWVKGQGQQGQMPSPGQRPMKATNAYPRSHSPGSAYQQSLDDRTTNSPSTPQKKANILVSRANIAPRPFQKNTPSRQRPQSAFGTPMNNSFQHDDSMNTSLLNNSRSMRSDLSNSVLNQSQSEAPPSYNNSYNATDSSHSNGPVHRPVVSKRTSRLPIERPKSVPPTMFNQPTGNDSDSSFNNEFPSNHRGTPPVPPPRKNKDILTSGKYSILREPTSPGQNSYSRGPMNNAQISPNNGPHNGPHNGSRPQEARIGPSGDSNHNSKRPAPQPIKPEEGEKANSIWPRKRVTFDIDGLPESMIL